MRRALLLSAALVAATPLIAQEDGGWLDRLFGSSGDAAQEEDQGGWLETLIEEKLSGEGRNVEITGFDGALSGRATIETLTISDTDGVWLTLNDAVLDWTRSALLSGRLEVAELSAAEILLPRLPLPVEADGPAPEATGFALPELPVSVTIDELKADRVEIGAPVYGAETIASIDGSLSLDGGTGKANLDVVRLNGEGQLALDASYSNTSRELALDLSLSEAADGILANMLDLPGKPALDFAVRGEAPIDEYTADIRLATDGQDRLKGRVTTRKPEGDTRANRVVILDLGGDVAPIFDAAYQPFFGPDTQIDAIIATFPDGRSEIRTLDIAAASMTLKGNLTIASSGLPETISLTGTIAAPDGNAVLLPLPGAETRVDRVDLDIGFDASANEGWTGRFQIAGLDRPGFSAEALTLDGSGVIVTQPESQVTAALRFDARRLDLGDPDAEKALGERVTGALDLAWDAGGPVDLTQVRIDGETYELEGRATVTFTEEGPSIDGRATVAARQLSAFSGLAQRPLGGAARLDASFATQPLAGYFDVTATGSTDSLFLNQTELDRILEGKAELAFTAARDETGTRLTVDRLASPNADLTADIDLKTSASKVTVDARLQDAALVLPQVTGPIRFTADAAEIGPDQPGVWKWNADAALADTVLTAEGTALDILGTPIIAATGRLSADDLSQFAQLTNRPIAGAIDATFNTEFAADLSRLSMTLDGTSSDLIVGQEQADRLIAGDVALSIHAAVADDVISISKSRVEGPHLSLFVDGVLSKQTGRFEANGQIPDTSVLLPGAPSGPLDFSAETTRNEDDWSFDITSTGPAATIDAKGTARSPTGPDAAVEGTLSARIPDLSVFSELANRALSGALELKAEGNTRFDLSRFDMSATAYGQSLSTGIADLDRLLAGAVNASVDATRDDGRIQIDTLDVRSRQVTLTANGALTGDGGQLNIDASLADVAPFAPGFSGSATATGTVGQTSEGLYTLDLDATGPGGARAAIDGTITPDVSTLDLDVTGTAPLGLLNRTLAPRSVAGQIGFDLSVNGPPALSSVSGRLSASDARLVAPELGVTVTNISLNAALAGARADISTTASVSTGGILSVEGPITLTGSQNADLTIRLANVILTDPRLFQTSLSGQLTVSGPLSGGARIEGNIALGETDIRIPNSPIGGAGAIPEVIHINEPPPVRGTRARAGLLDTAAEYGRGGGPSYPLDIRITAPNRLFVRGRGLDSEFGGGLRITGTTRDVVPLGAFNLIRGRLDILGRRLNLQEATVTMQGSLIPFLRIRATTRAEDITVTVLIFGPADNPEVTFTSSPELPQEEILARLLFGRGIETLSPIQAARLALAVRTLSGQGGEGVVGDIRSRTGLADFDVTSDEDGTASVRAGAYLTEDIYTDVTVDAEGETELNLNYDLTPAITLKGSTATDGETSLGIFFERDY